MSARPCLVSLFVMAAATLAGAAEPRVEYTVTAGDGARELSVEVAFTERLPLVFEDGFGRYARDVAVGEGAQWSPVAAEGDRIDTSACRRSCRVRYRFALGQAAHDRHDRMTAFEQQGALVAPASTFLARPAALEQGRFSLRVHTPPGLTFVSGLARGREPGTYEALLADLPESPYSAFGSFSPEHIEVGGGDVELVILPGAALPAPALRTWAEEAARDVAGYYGRFPVPRLLVLVVPGGRRGIGFGTTLGNGGATIMVWVAPEVTTADLGSDWVLTHEMVHLALPNLPHGHTWIEEGLATYVEPIARARRGRLGAEQVWSDLVNRTPQAVPGPGGLEGNRGFRAIYWGGALFFLLADVEIRERTQNRRSLDDALRGVQAAGGSIASRWSVDRTLAAADRATGLDVLRRLYDRMATKPMPMDLPSLWARLGIEATRDGIAFHEDAPLAGVRRAITGQPTSRTAGLDPTPPP